MPPGSDFSRDMVGVHTPVRDLLHVPGAKSAIEAALQLSLSAELLARQGHLSPHQIATYRAGIGEPELTALHHRLAALVSAAG